MVKSNAWGILDVFIVEKLSRTVYAVQGDNDQSYFISIDGEGGEPRCTCRGDLFHGHCKHKDRLERFLSS